MCIFDLIYSLDSSKVFFFGVIQKNNAIFAALDSGLQMLDLLVRPIASEVQSILRDMDKALERGK